MLTRMEDIYLDRRGRKCIFVESKKDIYSTLEEWQLLREKLSKSLEKIGYRRNMYDWCVMNSMTKGKNEI